MDEKYLQPPGDPVCPDRLTIPKSREFVRLLQSNKIAFASLLGCLAYDDHEVVVLEVEVELGQKKINPIERIERIAVVFDRPDQQIPEVLALRSDFPCVPHLNLRGQELPRSLCLYGEPYDEIKLHWSASQFVERIRTWLARTAKGSLHEEDQGLEPLLAGYTTPIVIPSGLFDKCAEDGAVELHVALRGTPSKPFYLASRPSKDATIDQGLPFIATVVASKPMQHGVIHKAPMTLSELHDFLIQGDFDLLNSLRETFRQWYERKEFRKCRFIMILLIPKCRSVGAEPESLDIWAFITTKTIVDVGQAIGVWKVQDNDIALYIEPDTAQRGNEVPLDILNPVRALSQRSAARMNGLDSASDINVVAIGLGALGSQIFMNLMRAGFGQWTLVDDDWLLPHNMARHALNGCAVGFPKAAVLAAIANQTIDGEPVADEIIANVLRSGEDEGKLSEALGKAGLIIDMSASVPVARHLALDVTSEAPRMSVFVNPSGNDLVVLWEGKNRRIPLDMLEMQLYRSVATSNELKAHLATEEGRIRYGRSCRDLSSRMSQDMVALHAAVASQAIKSVCDSEDSSILVWRAGSDPLTVKPVPVTSVKVVEKQMGDWLLRTDEYVQKKLRQIRADKLPNETGGILIGSFDLQRRIAYVVDMLPSPPDSEEWPTLYIRGCQGLRKQIEDISQRTSAMLRYVGEWHSHPDGATVRPSKDDLKVFAWLTNLMDADGMPALMMIPGSDEKCGMSLGKMVLPEDHT